MIDFEQLAAPFPPERISWRIGNSNKKARIRETGDQNAKATKGQALAFIDARDVMERLDAVCGPAGWQCSYSHANGKTVCDIAIKCGDEWISKADGAGDTDIEAEKGALSDAFKRSAVRWAIGRYLYDLPSPWVDLDERGQIPQAEYQKLEGLLEKHTKQVEWGTPAEIAATKALINTVKTVLHTEDDVRLFRSQNEGMIAQLRVKARERVNEELDAICETYRAKAA